MTPKQFALQIEKRASKKRITHMEAVLDYCAENKIVAGTFAKSSFPSKQPSGGVRKINSKEKTSSQNRPATKKSKFAPRRRLRPKITAVSIIFRAESI